MMNNKVPGLIDHELKSDNDDPFQKCKLNRRESAEVLTQLITNYREGFVLALNSEWGTGKTTFLKMWQEYLEIRDFETVHFNAWKTDYSADPFIALISQLDMFNQTKARKAYQSFLKKGSKLITKVGPGLLKGIVKHYIGDEALSELVDASAGIAADSLESQIDEQLKTEKSVDEFREALSELVKEVSTDGKPLVFIIDELDRCRPNYAVAVLEYIKHFFAVKGIVFVLGIDKEQLGHAVCGVYGSDNINADEYLRRFIDLEYSLPKPEYKNYCNFLYEYYNFDYFFASESRLNSRELKSDSKHFIEFVYTFFSHKDLNLRIAEKIFFRARVVMNSFEVNNYVFPGLYIYLLSLKFIDDDLYNKIINKQISLDDLAKEFEKNIFQNNRIENQKYHYLYVEACLLIFYRNYWNSNVSYENQMKQLLDGESNLQFRTDLKGGDLENNFVRNISHIRSTRYSSLSLSHLLNKIELAEGFTNFETSESE